MPALSVGLPSATQEPRDPTPDEVRDQMSRILGHRDFEASARTRDFLRYVVGETLAGRADRLKGYTVAVEVFGRGEDFDANLDPIVRIQAGRLRRALEHYYLVAGGRDPIVITLPKGRYVPAFSRAATDTGTSGLPPQSILESAARLPIGVAVAVLPFRELSAGSDPTFFAEGLREDLCEELSRYQDLVVIPCRVGLPPPDGARFVLEGGVRRGEEQVKVSVWLIDRPTGQQIWSGSYTCSPIPGRLVEAQEEIARGVSAVIGSELGVISQRVAEETRRVAPATLGAYEALLQYYHYQVTLDPAAGAQCAVALQAAVEREPAHGPLWSALASLIQHAYLLDMPGAQDRGTQATEYAHRGAALAPGSQLARGVLARSYFLRRERAPFLQEMEAALQLNPNSPAFVATAGYSLILAGEGSRGRPLLDRAIAMNPYYPGWCNHALCVDDYMSGNYESALRQTQKPAFEVRFWGPLLRAAVLGQLGRRADARAAASEIVTIVPDFERRARDLTHRPILSDVIVDRLLDGLRSAGLQIGHE